jgi:iron complex outermembrane receptor protein
MQSLFGHFEFSLSGAYNDSVLGPLLDVATYKFPTGYGITAQCAGGVTPLPGNTNCTDYLPYEQELSGEELPYAPKVTASATIQYAIPVSSTALLQPRVTYSYTSHQYGSLFQTDNYYYMGPRHLLNAYLDFESGAWRVTAYATNVANELYVANPSPWIWGNPRQIGLEVNRTF